LCKTVQGNKKICWHFNWRQGCWVKT